MTVGPALRRALHEALDLVLDAIAEESAPKPVKRRRTIAPPTLPPVTEEQIEAATRRLERAGYRRRAP